MELKRIIIAAKSNKTKKFTNTKLVIEKSKQNNLIENNKIIWNCSKGVYNMIFNNLNILLAINQAKFNRVYNRILPFAKDF